MKIGSDAVSYLLGVVAGTALTVLLAAAATALVPAEMMSPPANPIHLRDLPTLAPDEKIVVDFRSRSGTSIHRMYRFQGGESPAFTVWSHDPGKELLPQNFHRLGGGDLSPSQMRRLDTLLNFYRANSKHDSGGPPLTDTILVQRRKGRRLLQQEIFRSPSSTQADVEVGNGISAAPLLSLPYRPIQSGSRSRVR